MSQSIWQVVPSPGSSILADVVRTEQDVRLKRPEHKRIAAISSDGECPLLTRSLAEHGLDQTRIEEAINSLTHGIGAVLSVVAFITLVTIALLHGGTHQIIGCTIYGLTLVLLYCASTLYHATHQETWKERFRLMDHVGIYLLIAGTYTPFTLVPLRGPWGWGLLATVWSLAAVGIWNKFVEGNRNSVVFSTLSYVVMGWIAVVAARPLLDTLPVEGIVYLIAGALFYTGGVYFFLQTKRFHHAIWHLFVLAGSISHFSAVLIAIFPASA